MLPVETLSLYELNGLVREIVEINLTDYYWVRAELSEVRVSQKGHCFVELIEYDASEKVVIAKARAVIMRNIYPLLKVNFEETTGQPFTAGLKVLLQVSVSFSEVYGYSLIVQDIDPEYTLGSIIQKRKEIWERLQREGVAEMNKELELPSLVQRIAVISSPTAAGYEDFCHQLDSNVQGFRFVHRLFPAMMQGDEVEKTVIGALEQIAATQDDWDAVVIIRGGGAVSDLNVFDSYALANNCAQFPLPILTGIGHERDICVLDMVANRHLKTPTAVAVFLIERMQVQSMRLATLEATLQDKAEGLFNEKNEVLQHFVQRLSVVRRSYVPNHRQQLDYKFSRICALVTHRVEMQRARMMTLSDNVVKALGHRLEREKKRMQLMESVMNAYDPVNVLKKGYSITMKDGKAVTDDRQVKAGDVLVTYLKDGEITSIVK
ncbi:MAG TPA: exodeoxyribonuclease VII large subunit [Prevotellaceae bacterium]|jgi:exodeoxyribonuclease VII large subunit|nr:exodeoxyribonuclease VII large subunit [Prevotellaceae bacterium]